MDIYELPLVQRAVADPSEPDTLTFIASDDTVDRAGDRIRQNFDVTGFKENPVFLWQHRSGDLPLGRVTKIQKRKSERTNAEGKKVKVTETLFTVKFVPAGLSPLAETVRRYYEEGFLHAVSIGFRPLSRVRLTDQERAESGMTPWGEEYDLVEILELSAVTVPMNANALLDAKGKGIDTTPLEKAEPPAPDTLGRVRMALRGMPDLAVVTDEPTLAPVLASDGATATATAPAREGTGKSADERIAALEASLALLTRQFQSFFDEHIVAELRSLVSDLSGADESVHDSESEVESDENVNPEVEAKLTEISSLLNV